MRSASCHVSVSGRAACAVSAEEALAGVAGLLEKLAAEAQAFDAAAAGRSDKAVGVDKLAAAPAMRDPGLIVQPPPFISEGEVSRGDTAAGTYLARGK